MTEPHKWLEFARDDLAMAESAIEKVIFNQACFHAQQGVEKALKGYLRGRKDSIPKTHSLNELLTLCRSWDEAFAELERDCERLDRYYIPTRYPDAFPGLGPEGSPTGEEAREAVALLTRILGWITKRMG
jgi:HEPN domain-containing protein